MLTDPKAHDTETHAAATESVFPSLPKGNIYVTGNWGINRSSDGGQSWDRVGWLDLPSLVHRCIYDTTAGGLGGDTDVKTARGFLRDQKEPTPVSSVLGSYPAYASFLLKTGLAPSSVVLYHTGFGGALVDDKAECLEINVFQELGGVVNDWGHHPDKSTVALVDEDPQKNLPASLWVSWQSFGYAFGISSDFITQVDIESQTGDFGNHSKIERLNNPGESSPSRPDVDWGICTPPAAGGVDDAARGNLFADVDRNVYLAHSNVKELNPTTGCSAIETQRIYARRLTSEAGKPAFFTCIDEIKNATGCATKAPIIEENDPTIVVDPVSGLMVVSYLTQPKGAFGNKRVTLAWSMDGHKWTRKVVESTDVDADQAHVALAVTTALDPLDRVAEGTYFLTWYQPMSVLVPAVQRHAQVFDSSLQPKTSEITLSDTFFPRDYNQLPLTTSGSRGVYEFQGAAHAPGANRWVASWSAPRDSQDPDLSDENFGIWVNTVP